MTSPADPTPPIEIRPPDIAPYRAGNTGIAYATTFDSGRAGPHAMISAVVHGNELCGAIALDRLFHDEIRPLLGRLTLVFANPDAYESFDLAQPNASRFVDEDFNRVWSDEVLESARTSAELERARALRPLIDEVDFLLDLHSMQSDCAPLILSGPAAKGRRLATALGSRAVIVADEGHAAGHRLRDYDFFSDPADRRNSLLVECGQHWRADTALVASDVAARFLLHLGMTDADAAAPYLLHEPAEPDRWVQVTDAVRMQSNRGRFIEPFTGLEVIADAGTVIGHDGDEEIRTPYDQCVLIMPARRIAAGQTAVRLGRYMHLEAADDD